MKRHVTFLVFALIGFGALVAEMPHEVSKAHLSPLFPPAKKIHPHYIQRWTAPQVTLKAIGLKQSMDRWTSPMKMRLGINLKNSSSSNWSGYAAMTSLTSPATNSVSKVRGEWRVPTLHSSTSSNPFCSVWVGIDGYSNEVVEQAGTTSYLFHGQQYNYAWIELYPAWPFELDSFPVDIGDEIYASVINDAGSNDFIFNLMNKTTQKSISYSAYQPDALSQSAEWIVEAPSGYQNTPPQEVILPLANFHKIIHHNCYAIISGQGGSISASGRVYDKITMRGNAYNKATPSSLSDHGKQFTITWNHE